MKKFKKGQKVIVMLHISKSGKDIEYCSGEVNDIQGKCIYVTDADLVVRNFDNAGFRTAKDIGYDRYSYLYLKDKKGTLHWLAPETEENTDDRAEFISDGYVEGWIKVKTI